MIEALLVVLATFKQVPARTCTKNTPHLRFRTRVRSDIQLVILASRVTPWSFKDFYTADRVQYDMLNCKLANKASATGNEEEWIDIIMEKEKEWIVDCWLLTQFHYSVFSKKL